MPNGERETFGALLQRFRLRARLSRGELAERARMGTSTIAALERGTRSRPYHDTVERLAAALQLARAERDAFEASALRWRAPRDPAAAGDAAGGDAALPPPHRLPAPLTRFFGRERELAVLAELLGTERFLTLVGPGGMGKTRLAVESASAARAAFADGVYFVDLARVEHAGLVPAALAAALDVPERVGEPLPDAIARAFAARTALVVLDNCEQVRDACGALAAGVLAACAGLRILATSRERLGAPGERVVAVGELQPGPAIALFLDRARAVKPYADALDAEAIAAVCRRLEGIPLAIELAGPLLRAMSPAELASRLDERLRLLVSSGAAQPERHRSLRVAFDWSYDLLAPPERALFRRLGIFAGGWTFEAMRATCSDGDGAADRWEMLDLVTALIDKSLVIEEDTAEGEARYRMLDTLRASALEKLHEAGETDAMERRRLRHCRELAERAWAAYEATGSDRPVSALEPELDNVRAGFAWALAGGDRAAVADGALLAAAVAGLWNRAGLLVEGIGWLEAFIAALPDDAEPVLARLWTALAGLTINTGRTAPALVAAERAVAYARQAGDAVTSVHALAQFALMAAKSLRYDAAAEALVQAVAIAGPVPTARQRLRLLEGRGLLAWLTGDHAASARAYEELLDLHRALGHAHGEVITAHNLAESEHALGRTERAIRLLREVLPRARDAVGANGRAALLMNLAGFLVAAGDSAGARARGRGVHGLRPGFAVRRRRAGARRAGARARRRVGTGGARRRLLRRGPAGQRLRARAHRARDARAARGAPCTAVRAARAGRPDDARHAVRAGTSGRRRARPRPISRRDDRRPGMNLLRMFLVQTKMHFLWYFRRDGEMMFWTLAMPVFFLVLFSFAFSDGKTSRSAVFLVPGIIGAQVLSSGFWGVGVMLATFREKQLLRRVYLTPIPPWIFFASLVTYRMALLATQAVILIAAGALLFHVRIIGNPLEILAILLLGTATFVSLGTIIGALARTTESANNIASVLTVPLAFVSDAYVPIDRFPHAVSSALRLLPSTEFVDIFRAVSVAGAPLAHYGAWLAALVLWTIAGTVISARTFRWV